VLINKNGNVIVNRGPPSLSIHLKKEVAIKSLEMLASGVIEPSLAVYYSHPVIVQKQRTNFDSASNIAISTLE
jgi:hypothetical protein